MFCRLCSLCSGLANNQMQKTGAEAGFYADIPARR